MRSNAQIAFFPESEPRLVGDEIFPMAVAFTDAGGAEVWMYFRDRVQLLNSAKKLNELARSTPDVIPTKADPFLPKKEAGAIHLGKH